MKNKLKRKFKKRYLKYRPTCRISILNILVDNLYYYLFPNDDKHFSEQHFFNKFGYKLNLKEPKTYNEKIQWLKLNDKTDLHTICADKLLVREFITNAIGSQYLIPLVFNTKKATNINKENLPNYPCIIKTNHDSGTYFIINNKSKENWKLIQKSLKKSLSYNYFFNLREWQYKGIAPQIIVEKLLIPKDGSSPKDYKFHCSNGEVIFIQVDSNRETKHQRNTYDINWNLEQVMFNGKIGPKDKKPYNFELMMKLAKTLSKFFVFARIDFYEINKKIYFGEITFHPAGGFKEFNPKYWDIKYGKKIILPI